MINVLICITPYKHIFHYECLSNYVEVIKEKQKPIIKCPLCNYDFIEEKDRDENNSNNENNNNSNINENNNNDNNIQQNNYMLHT